MYAIVETGGKQYRVEKGSTVLVEKLEAAAGAEVILDKVLVLSNGETVTIGRPLVAGATVITEVLKQDRAPKVLVFKKRSKKGYKKMQGHRQYTTELKVKEIKQG